MNSGWRRKWLRVSQMSADELRTRVGQEIRKRLDLLEYWAGLRPSVDLRSLKASRSPQFFFTHDEVPARAALLKKHLPGTVDAIRQHADDICHHQFHLLGYEKLDYGEEIDWHLDAVHGKRAPLKPWFKIAYLKFAEVGDHKITWELNRHQHLPALAKAWLLFDDSRYLHKLKKQWYDWRKANPYPLGINWASTLEVAFRSLSWLWVRSLLGGSPALSGGFDEDLLVALDLNGRYIERYLSTYFSPNTHLIGEAVALFFIGTLCPELPGAQRWQRMGWKITLEEAQRQVRPDGVYFEQALYYHVYALDFFLHSGLLASLNGISIPDSFDEILRNMLSVLSALSQSGVIESFGDDDGGRVFDPQRNRVEHLTDPLAIGALLFGADYSSHPALTEESIWLFGQKAVEELTNPKLSVNPSSTAFESGGIYVITDSEPDRQLMMIDGGPQGIGHSGHGHADALSVRLSANGQRVLVDSGTCCYFSGGEERNLFRGTGAHNTLRIDQLDQAVPEGPFAWSSLPQTKVERWVMGETFDYFSGSHDGYTRLKDPVIHRRSVLHVKRGLWFIHDLARGNDNHLLESNWYFPSDLNVKELERNTLTISNVDESFSMALVTAGNSRWNKKLLQAQISPAYGAIEPATLLRISSNTALPAEYGMVLVSRVDSSLPGKLAKMEEAEGTSGYRYETVAGYEYLFFAIRPGSWNCGPWSSDAEFLYCRVRDGRVSHLLLVGGSFAKCDDKVLIGYHNAVERFEWINDQGKLRTSCSENCSPEEMLAANLEIFVPVL